MRIPSLLCFIALVLADFCPRAAHAGLAYPEPPGGWTYLYEGDKAAFGEAGSGFTSLDGTWSHDNGSDEWDGSAPGGALGDLNRPGGAGTFTEGGITFLRIQDTGDPRDYGYADPGSNRKVYLGHDIAADGGSEAVLDEGITLSFRARIPSPSKTSSPLDGLHRDGQNAGGVLPYPAEGDGYVTSDGGKGNFVIRQASGGAIAFSLSTLNDNAGGDPNAAKANFAGLTMNEFAGNVVSANVNFGQGTGTNVVAFDPTQWHELWIVLRKDPANVGTHQAFVYMDGSLTPTVFRLTAGSGSDYTQSYLAIGSTATPQNSALDIDFVAYKLGVNFPPGFAEPPGGWTYIYHGDKAAFGEAGSGFTSLDGTWSHDNGSDEWDGSAPGGDLGDLNRPGGAGTFTEGGITFLRIQDTGDPRDFGYADPGSNRKVYLGHDIAADGGGDAVLDDGITLSFRARIPSPSKTSSPLDGLHRDGQNAGGVLPYPAEGDGYVTSDGGKGNFVIRQASGGAIAFSLSTLNDNAGGDPNAAKANFAGLTMNEFAGNVVSANVNFGQGTGTNVVAFDPTQWHELWIVLRKDPANVGTHQAFVYLDGSQTPTVFRLTAGSGSDYTQSYLAIGSTATPQNSALDIDYVAYRLGAVFPSGAEGSLPPEITNLVPAPTTRFHPATTGLSFDAEASGNNTLATSGFKLVLNGRDVSANLAVTGTSKNRNVKYAGLQANRLYSAVLIAADEGGHSITNRMTFDTFVASTSLVIEAEDFNHSSGQFQDNSSPGGYLEFAGTPAVDYFDLTQTPGEVADHIYRSGDLVSTRNSADIRRQSYVDADLQEVHVALVQSGDWLNYTRTVPSGQYNAYLRSSSTAPRPVQLDRVTGNRSQPDQTKVALGTFQIPSTGSENAFVYTPLTDSQGQVVTLDLAGVQTLRLTALAANNDINLNYWILVQAPPPDISTPPSLSVTRTANGLRIEFEGTLDQADAVSGPYSAVNGATSPHTATTGEARKFYRARR